MRPGTYRIRPRRGNRLFTGDQDYGAKLLLQALPAFEIIVLQLGGFDRIARQPHGVAALEHERHGVVDLLRLELRARRLLPALGVRAVRAHAIVQARAARQEAFRLGVIGAVEKPHELGHDVAMEPRRPERVFADQPARREDREIDGRGAGKVRGRGQDGKDRRIGMIEADRADDVEARQIVFVRREVAVPGDHVERRMLHLRRPQIALEFRHQAERAGDIFVGRDRREKIARIGKAVGAERAELRQAEHRSVILADVAARGPVRQFDAEAQAARDDHDLAAGRLDHAELGDKARTALLRHDQHLAVGIVEAAVGHRSIGGIEMHRHADLRRHITVAAERHDAFDKIGRLARNGKRRPAQLRRRRLGFVERRAADQPVLDARIRPVHHRGLDAVGPGAAIFGPRGGERRAGNLLGIEPERRPLRRVAADRQCARDRFGQKLIAEAGLVLERRGGRRSRRCAI